MNQTTNHMNTEPSVWAFTRNFALLFAVTGMGVAFADGLWGELSGLNLGLAVGLGFGAGFVLCLPWLVGYLCFSRLPRVIQGSVWILISLAAGLYLASELNAFERLKGPHRNLAIGTIALGIVAGLGTGFLSWVLQPPARGHVGLTRWLRSRLRWFLAVGLVGAGITLLVMERQVFIGLYPTAHKAMFIIGLWAVTSGLTFILDQRVLPKLISRPLWILGPALVLNGFMVLHKNADESIHNLRQRPTIAFSMDILRRVTDLDRDDYSSLLGGGDCAPLSAKVNPGATEIPGNGIDDNCRLGDATRASINPDPPGSSMPYVGPARKRPHASDMSVVLITVDTVRSDHLSVYGYKRKTSPQLERYVTKAMVFDRAYSSSAWTSLAISSMMRGLYPRRLKWTPVYETNKFRLIEDPESPDMAPGEKVNLTFTMPLKDPRPTLAQRLQAHGLYTAAVINDGYAEFLSAKMGVADGFDRFETMDDAPRRRRNVRGTVSRALKVLRQIPDRKHFFLWVHIFGPHDPSSKHRGSPNFGKTVVDRYDHELHYADAQLGRLLRRLRFMERTQRIATVITSDHGELFFKKRRYHGINLHESNIRVPIIISAPDWPTGRTETLASLVDVAPTILALTGAEKSADSDGDDLTPYVLGFKDYRKRIRIAETWYLTKLGEPKRDVVAAFDGRYKVVHNRLKNLTKVVSQRDFRKRPKNYGRKFKRAARVMKALNAYIERTSGPIWPVAEPQDNE